jgi:hypothetical protein
MLIEMIIYISLFASLFSGAFAAAFQTVNIEQMLSLRKDKIEDEYFLSSRLNLLVHSLSDWQSLQSEGVLLPQVVGASKVEFVSSEFFQNAELEVEVLNITLKINGREHTFFYERKTK